MSEPLTATSADIPPGFAFHPELNPHLHFVASDANEPEVLVLTFTTRRRFVDTSCVVEVGEHPFVTHQTCVSYYHAQFWATQDIADGVNSGILVPYPPLSPELMIRVLDGAAISRDLDIKYKVFLRSQNLIV